MVTSRFVISRCCCGPDCNCDFSDLYVCLADGLTVEVAGTPFVITETSITWSIKVICDADGQSQVFELPAVSCNATDCQELDLTGTMVGSCDVGVITFGNDASCCNLTECPFVAGRNDFIDTGPFDNQAPPYPNDRMFPKYLEVEIIRQTYEQPVFTPPIGGSGSTGGFAMLLWSYHVF